MAVSGIHHLYVTTHDYRATLEFWTSLSFTIGFETDHGSAQLLPPGGGPNVFVDTVEVGQPTSVEIYLDTAGDDTAGDAWQSTHWGTSVQQRRDPDGRIVWLQRES